MAVPLTPRRNAAPVRARLFTTLDNSLHDSLSHPPCQQQPAAAKTDWGGSYPSV